VTDPSTLEENERLLLVLEYDALVALARKGVIDEPDQVRTFEALIDNIDARHNVRRYRMILKWQEAGAAPPVGAVFPKTWPPEQTAHVELLGRPIGKVDVDAVLRANARKPVSIVLTLDPAGELGFTTYEAYFGSAYAW
jgi:hypothetical protein